MQNSIWIILFGGLFGGCSFLPQELSDTPSVINEQISEEIKTQAQNTNYAFDEQEVELYPVVYVFDGDTFETLINNKKEKVRILGIDTPEVDGGFRTADCYGDNASKYAKQYLNGKFVALLTSKKGDKTDKYGRLLRYVFVDGEDFGAHLIETGYAEAYKKFPHDRRSYYISLEKVAQKKILGMWNPEDCSFWGQEN